MGCVLFAGYMMFEACFMLVLGDIQSVTSVMYSQWYWLGSCYLVLVTAAYISSHMRQISATFTSLSFDFMYMCTILISLCDL